MKIKDRIKELRRVPARELRPNPKNWRTHPPAQQEALRGILADVGYAGALLARESADGELLLIDGHLRAETTPDQEVPVLILDVTQAEADKLLATLDPLAAMAGANQEALQQVLATISTDNAALQSLLKDLAGETAAATPAAEPVVPTIEPRFSIIIDCRDEDEQVQLLDRFTQEGLTCRAFVV